ncbi:helix-turn-helix domain-containing protein [Cohnella panacarvi]|uniref:helix-turn-helix domain-containing protein n=1 Tax=Cohnella panacarvi TaxID=400776 RepID=UPI00047E60DA|nr:helix-turn-helix transcriptional regulator [Cohnella panacarvi]
MQSNISLKIKLIRNQHNLNQVSFAEIIGVSQATLSEIETGKSKPSCETLQLLAKTYGVDLNWLLLNIDSQHLDKLNEQENILLKGFRNLQEVAKREMLEFLEMKLSRYHNRQQS